MFWAYLGFVSGLAIVVLGCAFIKQAQSGDGKVEKAGLASGIVLVLIGVALMLETAGVKWLSFPMMVTAMGVLAYSWLVPSRYKPHAKT